MKVAFFFLIFFMGPVSHALTLGIQSVNPSVTDKVADGVSAKGQNDFGFSGDFILVFPIDSTYSFRTGLGIAQRNFSIHWTSTSGLFAGLNTSSKHGFTNLEIPLQLRVQLVEDLSTFFGTRLSTVIAKSCSVESLTAFGVTTQGLCDGVSTLTTPLDIGVHYQFFLGYGVELYYQLALNNLVSNSGYDLKINIIGLNLIFSI